MQLVEESLYHIRPVGSRVQAELPGRTQPVLVHLAREHKRVLHQGHHLQTVAFHRKPGSPASPGVKVPLTVTTPHPGAEALTRAAAEAPRQPVDATLQLQPASGPLAHSHPGRLTQGAPLEAPDVEELRGKYSGEVSIHLDQACGTGEGGVGKKPRQSR